MQQDSKSESRQTADAGEHQGDRDMEDRLRVRLLPGNRYELRLGSCIPVEMSASTYFGKSVAELRRMVEEMTLYAFVLNEKYDYDLPIRHGRFLEGEREKFSLETDETAYIPLPVA